MSGIFKAIGKIFKKVIKIVKKVLPYALMIGAVVLTGGAALGILPAVGTVLGGLGLSAGVTSILTGAVISGAVGAGLGAITSAVTGNSILKGATAGFIGGAISGGVLGAISPTAVAGLNSFIGGKGLAAGSSLAQSAATSLGAGKAITGVPTGSVLGGLGDATYGGVASTGVNK